MYPDDEFLPEEAFDEITKGEYEDMMEDHNVNDVLNRFVRLSRSMVFTL
jgi:hypothetical protein